jgi:hypothetical protein
MSYDLDLVQQLCREIGLSARIIDVDHVDVDLGEGAALRFQNAESEADCLIGFPAHVRGKYHWHIHDPIQFGDHRGYIELDYLDLVVALKEGRVLVCERQMDDRIVDRWLAHHEHIDAKFDFQDLQEGERIVVRRATTNVGSNLESEDARPLPNLQIVKTEGDGN